MTARPQPLRRVLPVALLVVAGATVVGFFTGTREVTQEAREQVIVPVDHAAPGAGPPAAPEYAAVRDVTRPAVRPGTGLERLRPAASVEGDPGAVSGGDRTARALRQRAAGRAYKGAPPQIPHAISQRAAENCMICHGAGLRIGVVRAPKPSHGELSNCAQCHVTAGRPTELAALTGADEPVFNAFEGFPEPPAGARAWPGAPPTIPHATTMRTDCAACHGAAGIEGLRTRHPERGNCRQCHASTAAEDMPVVLREIQ
jgi:cytochrome c-type protein NapB